MLLSLFALKISLGKALTTLEIALLFVGCHYCLRSQFYSVGETTCTVHDGSGHL